MFKFYYQEKKINYFREIKVVWINCVSTSVNSAFTYVLNQVVEPASNGKQFLDLRSHFSAAKRNCIRYIVGGRRHLQLSQRQAIYNLVTTSPRENLLSRKIPRAE